METGAVTIDQAAHEDRVCGIPVFEIYKKRKQIWVGIFFRLRRHYSRHLTRN